MFAFRLLPAAGLAAALPLAALAQTAPAPTDTARHYRHHLGLAASPVLDHFFTANRALPVALLYKHEGRAGRLWRYGLTLNQNYSRQDEYRPDFSPSAIKSNPEYRVSTWGASASVGQEYSYRLARRWTATAGADITVGFSQYNTRDSYQRLGNPAQNIPSFEVVTGYRERYYQASLTPFVGMRFYCWSQLYVSAESAIQLSYLRTVHNGLGYVTDISTGAVLLGELGFSAQQITRQYFSVRYRLINQISLHYVLGFH